MTITNRQIALAAAFVALLAALFTITTALAPQRAEAGLPAICEQYPDLPQCELPDRGTFCERNPDAARCQDNPAPRPEGTGDADGELPFTGYPLTDLILLLLAMLVAGLLLRSYLAARDRLGGRA